METNSKHCLNQNSPGSVGAFSVARKEEDGDTCTPPTFPELTRLRMQPPNLPFTITTFKPTLQISATRKEEVKKHNKSFRSFYPIIVIIILDILLWASFALYLAAYGAQQVYLGPFTSLMESYKRIQDDNVDANGFYFDLDPDVTYYNRQCSSLDISTTDSNDLIIPQDSNRLQAADKMMVHGAVIMKDILSQGTAAELRDYLETRHAIKDQLPYMEVFFEEIGRLSLGIGTSDHPIIGKALEEVGNHSVLKTTLEGILGEDPAIIEISTLTTLHGAEAQGEFKL